MSDFFREATRPVARKAHRCIGCFHPIAAGEQYHQQTGNYDGRWFCNRLHFECADALQEESGGGWYEFMPGELDPPARLLTPQATEAVQPASPLPR